MWKRFTNTLVSIPSFVVLLLGVGAGHAIVAQLTMPSMGHEMPQSTCQVSCASQFNSTKEDDQKLILNDEDDEPQPFPINYLVLLGVGWSIILLLPTTLTRHLNWRPPDINRLHFQYPY